MDGNMDERTQKYFQGMKQRIGYIDMGELEQLGLADMLKETAPDVIPEELIRYKADTHSIFVVSKFGISDELRYSIEFTRDGFVGETLIFSKLPTKDKLLDDILSIRQIHFVEHKIKKHDFPQKYICLKCGRRVHWLDPSGSLPSKIDRAMDRVCQIGENC